MAAYRETFRYSLYATAVIIILTLTGIFSSFESRDVITDILNLSQVVLIVMLCSTGYSVGQHLSKYYDTRQRTLHGALAGFIVGIALAIMVLLVASFIRPEDGIDIRFMFRNLQDLRDGTLTFSQDETSTGLLILIITSTLLGGIGAYLTTLSNKILGILLISTAMVSVIGLLNAQLENIITLPDALSALAIFALAYLTTGRLTSLPNSLYKVGIGAVIGIIGGGILLVIINGGGLDQGGVLRGTGTMPVVLKMAQDGSLLSFFAITIFLGVIGALAAVSASELHNTAIYLILGLILLGILNSQGEMNLIIAVISFILLSAVLWFLPGLAKQAEIQHKAILPDDQRSMRTIVLIVSTIFMFTVPAFVGQYITSVFDLVLLYIIMGIGLNVMVGYAGLLDLGYVASYAIGAYTAGILTTPSIVTIGCTSLDAASYEHFQMCSGILQHWGGTGLLTFWQAWPIAVLFSAMTGMLLGVPVLRLRGDYLAIVTLGFGEIINRILLSSTFKPLLGGAQGISPIPTPIINLRALNESWYLNLGNATNIYYLFLVSAALAAFLVLRLTNSRLGRAWRAIRADEDVAQAMGIHLVKTKLLAFGLSSAFAGLGGAIFGSWLQGIFPNSFTLFVSINVLSLIIIGGMGSIPGVIIGAFILIGLPEALREVQDYRLLAFGVLLVIVMLSRPEGLLPPKPPRLSEQIHEKETALS